jgi:hypothetical protein
VFYEFAASAKENPDSIGWSAALSTLIECKATRSDFLIDSKKNGAPKSAARQGAAEILSLRRRDYQGRRASEKMGLLGRKGASQCNGKLVGILSGA